VDSSDVQWEFTCDMRDGGHGYVDGELFYEYGEFKVYKAKSANEILQSLRSFKDD